MAKLTGVPGMLEPEAGGLVKEFGYQLDSAVQLSIAISLRRIADILCDPDHTRLEFAIRDGIAGGIQLGK